MEAINVLELRENSHLYMNGYVEVLKTSHYIPFDSLSSPSIQEQFVKLGDLEIYNIGYDDLHYWFRFKVYNPDTLSHDLIVLLGQIGIRDGELFQSDNQKWKSLGKIGYQYSFESRPYHFTHYAYPISVAPGISDSFYLWTDESHAYRVVAMAMLHPVAMKRLESRFYTTFGFMIGLLVLFGLFNLYLYFTTANRIHFWYMLYIVFQIILLIKHEGFDTQFLGMDSIGGYRSLGMGGVGVIMIALLMHVLQQFFANIPTNSILFRVTSFSKWFLAASGLSHFFVFYFQPGLFIEVVSYQLCAKGMLIGLILILANCVYSIYKGQQSSWLIFAGLLLFLLGGLERILWFSTVSYIFPPSLFQIGMVAETVVISFGLMYRYGKLQKERERIARELQNEKIQKVRDNIHTQENERKRIAQDLHDDLGSNLAVIQLKLQSMANEDDRIPSVVQLVDETAALVRQISHDLMPPEFENMGLQKVIKAHLHQLNNESATRFYYYQSGGDGRFSIEEELMIYRIFMEITNNILRHAKATEATVQLFYHHDSFELVVEDNGIGFSDDKNGGIGLKNIKSRIQFLQGELVIDSNLQGTTVIISIPLNSEES